MTTRELAARYIDEQIGNIKRHGGQPRLDADQKSDAIEATTRTFDAIRAAAAAKPSTSSRDRSRVMRHGLART